MRDKRRDRAAERLAVAEVRDAVRASCIPPQRLAILSRAYEGREGVPGVPLSIVQVMLTELVPRIWEVELSCVGQRARTARHTNIEEERGERGEIRTVLVRVHWYVVDGCESERTAVHAPLTS